jgi:hypothetical protein
MRIVGLLLFNLFMSGIAIAQSEMTPKPGAKPVAFDANGAAIYKLIDLTSRFPNTLDAQSPLVYRGTKSEAGEFPEVGFLGFCTATAVGPKILYTAAHCVNNGQRISWKRRKDGVSYPGVCNHHPQYNDNTVFNDYAFCILDGVLPADSVFASFNISGSPAKGDEALVNGFGAPNLGTHYWGKAVINGMQGQDIVTCGPANLGGGDSGGAFFKWSTDRNDPRKHIIDGTNSRAGGGCSYFNTTSHPNFKPYGESQVQKCGGGDNCYVCGVTKDCSKPIDPNRCKDEHEVVRHVEGVLGEAKARLALCEKGS